jgi:hypothetical protein
MKWFPNWISAPHPGSEKIGTYNFGAIPTQANNYTPAHGGPRDVYDSEKALLVEVEHDFLNDSMHILQRGENLLPANPCRLSEGDLESKSHFVVHLGDGKGTQFAAIFERTRGTD